MNLYQIVQTMFLRSVGLFTPVRDLKVHKGAFKNIQRNLFVC